MEDSVAAMYERHPLIAFSVQTHVQVTALLAMGEEIQELIVASVSSDGAVDGAILNMIYARLWLWVLGVYEVLRTMSQARVCFVDEIGNLIVSEKRYIARLRMPLSKQEFERENTPSGSTGMFSRVDIAPKDVSFDVRGEVFSAKSIIIRFSSLIEKIKLSDIKGKHIDSYR